jgi:HEAT repeat protein
VPDPEGAAALRRAAVDGLAGIGTAAVPALLGALRDRHARLRECAIEALGGVGGADSVQALGAALHDDRSNVRQAAAPALARAGGAASVAPLRAGLSHKDPATRRSVALALGSIPDESAADALRAALADRDRGVRDAAVQSLVAQASPAAAAALCAAALDGNRDLRAAATGGLKGFDWAPADAPQRAIHAVLRGRYAEAAREGDAAVAPLVAALSDRDPGARAGAAAALGGLKDERTIEALAALLADPDAAVRDAAVDALTRTGTAASVHLARALDDRGGPARPAAARVIGALGEGAVAAALLAPLQAGQPTAHGGVALRVVGTREALDRARDAADDLALLAAHAGRRLPAETLRTIAAIEDVMLIEPGRVPDPDERVACDALRAAAQRELQSR